MEEKYGERCAHGPEPAAVARPPRSMVGVDPRRQDAVPARVQSKERGHANPEFELGIPRPHDDQASNHREQDEANDGDEPGAPWVQADSPGDGKDEGHEEVEPLLDTETPRLDEELVLRKASRLWAKTGYPHTEGRGRPNATQTTTATARYA